MLEKKATSSGRLRRTFFSILGTARSKSLLSFLLHKKHIVPLVSFPIQTNTVNEILLILPEEHLQVLHQLKNVISLISLFKQAAVTLLCERSVAPYIKMVPGLNVIEYDAQDHFSSEFSSISQRFRGNIDICFLLDTQADLPMLYLAGSTAAPTRVGYAGAGDFPFLNLHIRPSPEKKYLPDRYCSMAATFGATPGEIKWRVAKKTIEEIDHLIRELKIAPGVPLVGFDAIFFIKKFGISWTEKFLVKIQELNCGTIYFHVEDETPEKNLIWLCKQNVPSFADLSASRVAALVSKSEIIISGNTPLYALAGLLHRRAVGFFQDKEMATFCPQNTLLKGIAYSSTPDDDQIAQILILIANHPTHKRSSTPINPH